MLSSAAIDNAIAGRYALPKLKLLRRAWQIQAATGKPVRRALIFLIIAILPVLFLLSHLLQRQLPVSPSQANAILGIASLPLVAPWITGLMLIGIDAARDIPTGFHRVLECYQRVVPLTVMALMTSLASAIGAMVFILPGLYLLIGCTLALPLVVDAQLSPLRAMMVSLKSIHHRWFDFAGIVALLQLTMIFSVMLAGLPLWLTLPWLTAVVGAFYCAIFRTDTVKTRAPKATDFLKSDKYSYR